MSEIIHAFGLDWRLLIIQIFNFSILLLILWYFLYRPLVKVLHERQQTIARGVENATLAESKLTEAEEEKKRRLTQAEEEAGAVVASARLHAKETADGLISTAKERGEALLADARAQSEEERAKAIREHNEDIARMAVLGAEKILKDR